MCQRSEESVSTTGPTAAEPWEVPLEPAEADVRHDRLARATEGVGRRSIPLDRWLQIAGAVLLPLGALLIVLGWYGTAHTSRVWEQMPYVVSGGLLGAALVFAGGFSYFAHWMVKLVEDGRQQAEAAMNTAERSVAALQRIEELLGENAVSASAATRETPFVKTAAGTMVHRPDCAMVQGKDNLRWVRGDEPGLRPCMVCQPPVPAANGGRRRGAERSSRRG
jgi:hypothetical protein